MILIELEGAVDVMGLTRTFYVSDEGFVTEPTDTPPDTDFEPRLIDPGSLGLHAYSDAATTGGGTQLEIGEIVLANADGGLDDWISYGFDGRPIRIRYSLTGAGVYPDDFPLVFSGTVESVEASWSQLVLRLRDRAFIFEQPALTAKYLGNNALPDGVEGTAADLKDRVKPRVFGKVFQVAPPQVNTSRLTYQVNNGPVADIPAVYDRGVVLTKGADFANNAALHAATLSAGTYGTCFAEGLFRLGASPAGQVTADVSQGATAADRTVAQVLRNIAIFAGAATTEISSTDVGFLDLANSAEVGIWLDSDSITFKDAMDAVAMSLSVWYGFDNTGLLRMGRLHDPIDEMDAVLYLDENDVNEKIERRAARDTGIPVYDVTLNHTKVWTVQTDLAGSVPADRKAYLAQEYRKASAVDSTVQLRYKLATKLRIDSLLTQASDAVAEAARQLALYSAPRSVFEVTIPIEIFVDPATPIRLMDVINLKLSRFNLSYGKMFLLIGVRYELANDQITLSLWG